jgi:hypothetical protein
MNKTIWAIAFVVLACGTAFAIDNATATEIDQNKFTGTGTAGNITTEGGNVSQLNIGTNISTEKWAGMYGNVSGQIVLSEAANSPYMYSWVYDVANGGTVCASKSSVPVWVGLTAALKDSIDSVWVFPGGDADSANRTMTDAGASVVINGAATPVSANVSTVGGWNTVAVRNMTGTSANTEPDFAFCVNINGAGTAFTGSNADFQLMVPTTETALAVEQYFFFVELS